MGGLGAGVGARALRSIDQACSPPLFEPTQRLARLVVAPGPPRRSVLVVDVFTSASSSGLTPPRSPLPAPPASPAAALLDQGRRHWQRVHAGCRHADRGWAHQVGAGSVCMLCWMST